MNFTPTELRNYRRYQTALFLTVCALQMVSLTLSWRLYELTRNPLTLGYVGLVQFLPALVFSFFSGPIADRFDRRYILAATYGGLLAAVVTLALGFGRVTTTTPLFWVLGWIGVARALDAPAAASLLPQLVSRKVFPTAVAWTSSVKQVANVVGPALGGVLYLSLTGSGVFWICAALYGLALAAVLGLEIEHKPISAGRLTLESFFAGAIYVRKHKLLLGALTLDLFAVLLGGAVALLPVFAQDVLHVGPEGLGILRSAPAVGSLVTALYFGFRPVGRPVGLKLLGSVIGFGVATSVFALSRNFGLTLVALFAIGCFNVVSVIIRQTLVQVSTPHEMRGRVSSVSQVCNISSNQLGEFESGLMASWIGTVPSVLVGGAGTIAVALIWGGLFPSLRRYETFDGEPTHGT